MTTAFSFKNKLLATACTALLTQLAAPATAQTTELASAAAESISVTATRTAKPAEDVPAVVSVITAEEIDENLVTDIKDLVQFEPGVSVRSAPARFGAASSPVGRDGNSGFNIRGLEGNRVLMIIDGIRIPDGFTFGGQSTGRGDYADVSLLKSVEILRGPASALYGSDGVAGVVNFITKDPEDFLRGARDYYVQAQTGYDSSDNTWANGVLGATRAGAWSFLGAVQRRDGHAQENQGTNDSANTDRTTPIPQDARATSGLAKVVFAPSEENRFRLTWDHLDSQTSSNVLSAIAKPPLATTSTVGLLAKDWTRRNRVMFDHRYDGAGFIDKAVWAAYYQDSKTSQFSAEDRNTAADRTRLNTFNNRVIGFSLQLDSLMETGDVTHHFVYGGEASFTRQDGLRDGTVPPAGETYPIRAFPTTNYTLAGVYVQDEISFMGGDLTLYPAVRFDHYKLKPKADAFLPGFTPSAQDGSRVSPKFGAVGKLGDEVRVFANYARGFKAPSPSQVNNFFANPVMFYASLPNPNLKAETSEGIDGGVRFNNSFVAAEIAGFASWYRNFIDQVQVSGNFTPATPGIFQYVNVGKAKLTGVEGKMKVDLSAGFDLNAAASYTRGEATTNGVTTPLNTVDPFKLVAGVGYKSPSLPVGGQVTATYSAGKDSSRIQQTCTGPCFAPESFMVLDATAYWNATEWAVIRAGVFNITDKKYWWWSDARGLAASSVVLDAYTQPGRNVRASLTLKY